MPTEKERLVRYLAELNDGKTLSSVDILLSCGVPSDELLSLLRRGMEQVNASYVAGEYFIADLIMANNIYREAVRRILGRDGRFYENTIGKAVIGTVSGDIHELGKNLIAMTLRCSGFAVTDIGTDVPPEQYVSAVMTEAPHLLILSGTISGSEIMMARTIEAIEDAGIRSCVRIVLGGNCIDEKQAILIGADAYSRDPIDCLRLCRQLVLGDE